MTQVSILPKDGFFFSFKVFSENDLSLKKNYAKLIWEFPCAMGSICSRHAVQTHVSKFVSLIFVSKMTALPEQFWGLLVSTTAFHTQKLVVM